MKEKFISVVNLIKTNKQVRYLVTLSVLVLFVIALNVTYSAFTSNNTNDVANIKIQDLSYNMQVNSETGNIITASANQDSTQNITIKALNNIDTKYELTYKVCATSACTSYIDLPEGVKVRYKNTTAAPVNGTIASNESKTITLVIENSTNTTYYFKLSINAGYAHNDLALTNQIFESTNDQDLQIISIIDGVTTSAFPTTDEYTVASSCTDNATINVNWNGTSWVANISTVLKRNVTCTINFKQDTLIAQQTANSTTSKAFNGPITKEQVEKIVIKNTNEVPSNAIASWDVSVARNGSIMAYTLDEDNDNLYELYIGQEGGVIVGSNASNMFANYNNLESIDLTNLKTSKVTNMRYMFESSKATILDLSSFDTSSVTDMSRMFFASAAMEIKGLDKFNTSNVTNMNNMFSRSNATEIKGLNQFNTSNVTDMSAMFYNSKATSIDLSSFDTSNVTNMSSMFNESAATEIKGLNQFNTSNVTNMNAMFSHSAATSLDVSSFDTSNVTIMANMFSSSKATSLDLSSFDTSKVTNMFNMFSSSAATSLDLSSFDTSKVASMSYMFYNSKATSINLSSFDTSKVTNMSYMFSGSAATSLDLSSFDTSNVTNMISMFSSSKATSLDLSSFDTSKVTSMFGMFQSSAATEIKGLNQFNTSNVTAMTAMFSYSAATSLDLSSFNTSNVTNMNQMFMNSAVTEIKGLNKFNTSKVINMSWMFAYSKATSLDLTSFDTSNVTNMSYMFNLSNATTGYARTQADADKFNASSNKPSKLTFTVKS